MGRGFPAQDALACTGSFFRIFGVMKINNSRLLEVFVSFLNRYPRIGILESYNFV